MKLFPLKPSFSLTPSWFWAWLGLSNCRFSALVLQHVGARNMVLKVWSEQDLYEGLKPFAAFCPSAPNMWDGPPGEGCPVLSHISPQISHYDGLSVYYGWSGLAVSLSLRWLTSFLNFLFLTSTLLLASSRNWYLITGKARSWSEGTHWLWEETDLQGVGERWLSRFTQEKTKPLFPVQAPCLRAQQLTHL